MDSPLCKPFQPSPLPPDVSPFPSGPSSATLFPSVSDNNRHLALLAALWMDLWQRLAVGIVEYDEVLNRYTQKNEANL
ncbi:hypothetical protein TNCT_236241 [Trichonephila clavata]|uniref:Uncharacterized protein n=1 Tax=Trichonephila clavata TaxID=2740835 RepID=A0A8X6LDX7_TRICU|nr:hypothetical protein TNCT_236241 [Trichonephila clavata]